MSLTLEDVKKIAHLARLSLSDDDLARYREQLSTILNLADEMSKIDANHIEPLANPLNLSQRLRPDAVTESNQRDAFQAIAPHVEAGLYIVPQVIEG